MANRFHRDAEVEAAIQPVLEAIRQEAMSLTLWRNRPDIALYHALAAFEYEARELVMSGWERGWDEAATAIGEAIAVRARGLNAIIRGIYRRGSDSRLSPPESPLMRYGGSPDSPPLFDQHVLAQARHALSIATQSVLAFESLYDACYGTRELQLIDSDVFLPLTKQGTIERETELDLMVAAELSRRPIPYAPIQIATSDLRAVLSRAVLANTRGIGRTSIQVPAAMERELRTVEAFFAARATEAVADVGLPLGLSLGGYSMREFCEVFRCVYRRAAIHQAFCWMARRPGREERGIANLPMWLRSEELHRELVADGSLSDQALSGILSDLTYDGKPRADIRFQPLLEVAPGTFLLAPTLLMMSRWECGLLKLWSRKYQDEYSLMVSTELKHRVHAVLDALSEMGFITAATHALHAYPRHTLRSTDIAAFDAGTRALLLAQVPWLATPVSSHESRAANAKLDESFERISRVEKFIREHPAQATRQLLFPHTIELGRQTDIRTVIICTGSPGSVAFVNRGTIVLDFRHVDRYLRSRARGRHLLSIERDFEGFVQRQAGCVAMKAIEKRFQLGGYRFRIP